MKATLEHRPWKGTYDLQVKRLSVPGAVLKATCPKCNGAVERDFEENYLSFPPVGKRFKETVTCYECEHEWEVTLRLDLVLTLED